MVPSGCVRLGRSDRGLGCLCYQGFIFPLTRFWIDSRPKEFRICLFIYRMCVRVYIGYVEFLEVGFTISFDF